MEVIIDWTVKSLPDITFYTKKCTVIHGISQVDIILGSCYSRVLGVEPLLESPTSISFSFSTFKINRETASSQTIECDIGLCIDGEECEGKAPLGKEGCPKTGVELYYGYIMKGMKLIVKQKYATF